MLAGCEIEKDKMRYKEDRSLAVDKIESSLKILFFLLTKTIPQRICESSRINGISYLKFLVLKKLLNFVLFNNSTNFIKKYLIDVLAFFIIPTTSIKM